MASDRIDISIKEEERIKELVWVHDGTSYGDSFL